ncbi:unnamed protein product [Linum tenue]|uniref:Glycine-rich protein n=1 Tax=Linum tenue TaxID=586396 RepID=A0AAV0JBK4_9ROSI|nr:unnamed protein product [Linum tenue]
MKTQKIFSCFFLLLLSILIIITTLSAAARPEPESSNDGGGGFFGPGTGIPEFGKGYWGNGPVIGGGYGSGFGGPKGGYSKSGTYRPSVVCKEKGPCLNKKLRCPAKCFSAYSRSGKGYGGGGGGGGCTMDCKKKCVAYC